LVKNKDVPDNNISMQLTFSQTDAILRLQVFDHEYEIMSVQGRGVVTIPSLTFAKSDEEFHEYRRLMSKEREKSGGGGNGPEEYVPVLLFLREQDNFNWTYHLRYAFWVGKAQVHHPRKCKISRCHKSSHTCPNW
jgi:hypothetical protein